MLRFLADENFNGHLLRALLRHVPDLDVLRVQEVGLMGVDDPEILEWAAQNGRVMLTHDAKTMVGFAYDRVRAEVLMPGVIVINEQNSLRVLLEDLVIATTCLYESELSNHAYYIPIRS